ncbi:MAG TPA: hypothetical protein VH500_04865 [Nitrososphaeraceae archaeon]
MKSPNAPQTYESKFVIASKTILISQRPSMIYSLVNDSDNTGTKESTDFSYQTVDSGRLS